MSATVAWQRAQPALPLLAWLLGAMALAAVLAETLFGAAHFLFAYARLVAYASSLMACAMLVGMLALFGLSCGLMLWWLDDPQSPARIFRTMCLSSWAFGVYTWIGVGLLLWELPPALTAADFEEFDAVQERLDGMLVYQWLQEYYLVVNGAFLVTAAALLARTAKPLNAVLAVAFGAAVLMALLVGLGALAGDTPA